MSHTGSPSEATMAQARVRREQRADEVERRTEDLVQFHDAGVLTDAELEEQKVRLRWDLGR